MSNVGARLWPYSRVASIIAAPVIWAVLAILFFATRKYLQWPVPGYETPLLLFSIVLSGIPLILMVLDFVATKGGVIGNEWFNVDFSKTVVEGGSARRESFGLPDNILSDQENIRDSGGMKIKAAIQKATAAEILCIDLKDGNAWWVTRLLALCAGVVGVGPAKAIVFIGKRENRERAFLGWGMTQPILQAILNASPEYRSRLQIARIVTQQIRLFANHPLQLNVGALRSALDPSPPPAGTAAPIPQRIDLHTTAQSYSWAYDENEFVMLATILIEELGGFTTGDPRPNLEDPPDRLTASRLSELFDHCLYRDSINRSLSNDQQLSQFLDSIGPYVAIVRQGVYEGMLRSDSAERAIIRELFARSKERSNGTAVS